MAAGKTDYETRDVRIETFDVRIDWNLPIECFVQTTLPPPRCDGRR